MGCGQPACKCEERRRDPLTSLGGGSAAWGGKLLFQYRHEGIGGHSAVRVQGCADCLPALASDFRILKRNRCVISERYGTGQRSPTMHFPIKKAEGC